MVVFFSALTPSALHYDGACIMSWPVVMLAKYQIATIDPGQPPAEASISDKVQRRCVINGLSTITR